MKKLFTLLLILILSSTSSADACSRVVYRGTNDMVVTGRTMDWRQDMNTHLWVLPRGTERNGEAGENSFRWKSKYGSVVATGYEIASTDGMNEKGLAANLLWLQESKYPTRDGKKPMVTISLWVQYVLDQFATVAEAVTELRKEEFIIVSDEIPGSGSFANLHLSLSDKEGDSAILEYIDGKLVIHHDKSYQVMTNSPSYDKQLELYAYWEKQGERNLHTLPKPHHYYDNRFAYGSYYINMLPKTDDAQLAVASTLSLIRHLSVPFGVSSKEQPNMSTTRWRVLADHKNLVYYYESPLTPNLIWLDLKDLDFSENAPTKKLDLSSKTVYEGNSEKYLADTPPFKFLGVDWNK